MEKVIFILCQLLGFKIILDVNELIEFFVVVLEFGLKLVIIGVWCMFVLVWFCDIVVCDVVVEVYKGLYLDFEVLNVR